MNQLNLDKLLYPIMMSIRSLRTYFKQDDENNRIILDCQTQVEIFTLSIMHFILDLIVYGSNYATISFNKNVPTLQKELNNKLDCIQHFVQSKDVMILKKNILKFYELKEGFSESESEDEGVSLQIKLTGKMKEFNPEIQQLRLELDQKESTIQKLKQKLQNCQNNMEQTTHNNPQEISVFKEQFTLNPEQANHQSIFNIKYFDQTQIIDPEIMVLMNEKINEIKSQYECYVNQFKDQFKKNKIQQNNEEILKKPSINDFTSKDLLKIALQKESNPYIFFKNIQDLKSINYIINILSNQEQEYGIEYDKINNALKTKNEDLKKLVDTRIIMQDFEAQMSAQFLVDLEKKKQEIYELNQMITQQEIEYKNQLKQFLDLIQNNYDYSNSNEMIIYQQQQIEQMRSENHNHITMLINQKQHSQQLKQQNQFLINNLKNILNILLNKQGQNNFGLDKYDLLKENNTPIKDILNKLNNIEGYDLFTLIQEVKLLLYQIESLKVVNQISEKGKLNKQTQTISMIQQFHEKNDENKMKEKKESKLFMKHLERIKQDTIKQSKLKIASTQTDFNEYNLIQDQETNQNQQTTLMSQSQKYGIVPLNMLLKQVQSSLEENHKKSRELTSDPSLDKNKIFDKLYTQQKFENPRWHQLKYLIEKLTDDEFLEVINTLEIYSYKQQQITQNTSLEMPQYNISKIQQTINYKSIHNRRRNSSVDQTKNVFIELDEQREQAQKLFEQQRIDTYRRRIKRLVPVQPSQCLQVEEKLRPKSQIRSSQQKPGY